MSDKSFKVKSGLTFTPVDLSSLTELVDGDIASDINDSNKIKQYRSGVWAELGDATTASNLGTEGEGVFAGKVASDFQFKKIRAGANTSVVSDANSVTIGSSAGGAGGSVTYYLNGGTDSSVLGYKVLSKVPNEGANADFTASVGDTGVLIAQFMSVVSDPGQLLIPAGNYGIEFYFSSASSNHNPSFYVEFLIYDGVDSTLIASNISLPEPINAGTTIHLYSALLPVPETVITLTDRLEIRVYVNRDGQDVTLHTQGIHLSQLVTTFSSGISALNGITPSVQSFATGSSGLDFNISSVGSTHTFNIPNSSSTTRGALSSSDWITFDNKVNDAVNIGTGLGVYLQKNGFDLELKSLLQGDRMTLTDLGNEIQITANDLAIIELQAGEDLAAGDLVYISKGTGDDVGRNAGQVYKVDPNFQDRIEAIGFCDAATFEFDPVLVRTYGKMGGFTGLTKGEVYFADTAVVGGITLSSPTTQGQWSVPAAIAISTTEIIINPVASASAVYVDKSEFTFSLVNNQVSPANITNLIFDPNVVRGFEVGYTIYRASGVTSVAQIGILKGVYNTLSSTWFLNNSPLGDVSGITFSITVSGQIQYTSTNIAGSTGTLKYITENIYSI